MKSVEQRVSESIEIRKQLEKLGIMLDVQHRDTVRLLMNEFIRTGKSCNESLRLDLKTSIIVKMTNKENAKSGVVLQKH